MKEFIMLHDEGNNPGIFRKQDVIRVHEEDGLSLVTLSGITGKLEVKETIEEIYRMLND